MLFLFFFYTHVSYIMYAIYYFYFTLRCCDEFFYSVSEIPVIKVFLAMDSLRAKFFKSLCQIDFIVLKK